jgi:hypothetical protein
MDLIELPPDSIAAGAMRAAASVQSLRDIDTLRQAAHHLIDAAAAAGCYTLIAANAAAEALTTAASLISDGQLTSANRRHAGGEKVLIVDTATVTGNNTRACAAELRARGAIWVGAVIFDRVRPDLDGLDADSLLDLVTTLHMPLVPQSSD